MRESIAYRTDLLEFSTVALAAVLIIAIAIKEFLR